MTAALFPKTPPGGRQFRSSAARFFGWAWMVFAAANLADLIWRGRDVASLVAATVILTGCGIAYVFALRPRIVADDDAVRLHNVFRDVHVPWPAVRLIEGDDAVYVHAGDRRFRAFVLQTSPRARAKAEMKGKRDEKTMPSVVAEHVRGRTYTDFAVEQLRELADAHARRIRSRHTAPGTGSSSMAEDAEPARLTSEATELSVTWAWSAVLALALPGAAFAVALIIALA